MVNANPYLILTRVRTSVIRELKEIFAPRHNTSVVPPFEYNYIESASTATLNFYGNPSNGDTFTIGTNVITFVTATPSGLQVKIGLTQQITLANLVALINTNSSTLLIGATTNSIPNQLKLTANTAGTSGNSIVLAVTSTVLKPSSPTLINGGLFDFDNSQIFISDAVPQDYQDWPCIVVDTASASETRYLGPEDSFQTKNSANVVTKDEIFSSLIVNVNIKVYTIDDTLARDKIIDLIYNNMSEIRHQLAVNGIEMIDRTLPTETRLAQNQRIYIENHFILRVYCEWSDNLSITNITSVSVTVPVNSSAPPIINSPLDASWSTTNNTLTFTIDSIDDSTHLTVGSTIGFTSGYDIFQGLAITSIISIIPVDMTHVQLEVVSTIGFVSGSASMIIPFNYLITALNLPTSYSATGLPSGLTVDASNGLISGVPTPSGTYYIILSAINSAGTGTQSLTLTVS
jgi:hypothetical protein